MIFASSRRFPELYLNWLRIASWSFDLSYFIDGGGGGYSGMDILPHWVVILVRGIGLIYQLTNCN